MCAVQYGTLADVYDWLVPEALRTPEHVLGAFAGVVGELPPGGRVLDCAAGTGELAVGLALRGFDVVASDASPAMTARAQALAGRRGVAVAVVTCRWDELGAQGWDAGFDAVFCVGNSLTHAEGAPGRRAALAGMAGVLRRGAPLVVTSRNWERIRGAPAAIEVGERLERRAGGTALVVRAWHIPDRWEEVHHLDVAVALLRDGDRVETVQERLTFWPFTEATLLAELRAAGLEPEASTYAPDAERYVVTARRR